MPHQKQSEQFWVYHDYRKRYLCPIPRISQQSTPSSAEKHSITQANNDIFSSIVLVRQITIAPSYQWQCSLTSLCTKLFLNKCIFIYEYQYKNRKTMPFFISYAVPVLKNDNSHQTQIPYSLSNRHHLYFLQKYQIY